MLRLLLASIALIGLCTGSQAQQAIPPTHLAEDICSCMGAINPESDDRTFDLAVRHCLNTAMRAHSGEVIELMRRFPAQDRRYYLLGLLLGSSLDKSCPQYPWVKDRLRPLLNTTADPGPNT